VTGPGAGSAPPAPSARRHSDPGGGYAESAGSGYADPAGVGYAEPAESLGGSAAGWSGQAVATSWEAVVEAERDYYDSGDDHRVPFPSFYPRRVFPLTGARLLVGRRSESRGIHPEIDLSGAPEDPGISRAHAILERRADGGYALLDPGSTNGTRLNDEPDPVEAGAPIPLQDGDRVYLGAWTRITVRAR
jgi:hypothetical protein